MPYEKLKDENYQNLGGINIKASDYTTGLEQVLDLRNYTFVRPGSWTSRLGYVGHQTLGSISLVPNSLQQYIFSGYTYGLSAGNFSLQPGQNLEIFDSGNTLYSLNYNTNGISAISGSLGVSAYIDSQVFNSIFYYANGKSFQKFNGYLNELYGVPNSSFPAPPAVSLAAFGATFASFASGFTWPAGVYTIALAPARKAMYSLNAQDLDITSSFGSLLVPQYEYGAPNLVPGLTLGFSLATPSTGAMEFALGISLPFTSATYSAYNVSFIGVFVDGPITDGEGLAIFPLLTTSQFSLPSVTLGLFAGITQYYAVVPSFFPDVSSLNGFYPGQIQANTNQFLTLVPQYLETYNNILMMAGFSTAPNTVWFSNIGDPDSVEPENFFPVNTEGDGDYITCLKVFQGSLIIFKNSSIHVQTGYGPETFQLIDLNFEYGCVNNFAVVDFENNLWFMDSKGICEYNGANTTKISYKLDNYLDLCDKSTTRAFLYKKINQAWFVVKEIATPKWKVFAYDYLTQGWVIHDDFNITTMKDIINNDETKDVRFFGYNFSLQPKFFKFDETLHTDDGFGITLSAKTRFHKRLGDSTTEMWRRLFLNNDLSATCVANINFYADYGASIVYSTTMGMTMFQSRIDYGVSAKALSVEIILQSTSQVRIQGYTVESRYLRSV